MVLSEALARRRETRAGKWAGMEGVLCSRYGEAGAGGEYDEPSYMLCVL
jgi:hypothetical protein